MVAWERSDGGILDTAAFGLARPRRGFAFRAGARDFFFMGILVQGCLSRLAGVYQVRIVHGCSLAMPCRRQARTYNPAYASGFKRRIE
jgi:hypothetical protein